MKFWIVFATYLLFLSALPCADKNDCNEIAKTEIQKSTNHQKHNNENENCSPFCICACCGVSVTQINPTDFTVELVNYFTSKNNFISYKFTYSSINFCNIWQPPKLLING